MMAVIQKYAAHDNRHVVQSHLLLLSAQLIIGLWNVMAKRLISGDINPLRFVALRLMISAFFGLALNAVRSKTSPSPYQLANEVPRNARWLVVLCGLCLACGVPICFIFGLQLTTPTVAAVMQPLSPSVAYAIGLLVNKAVWSPRKAIGIVTSMCSSALVVMASYHGQPNAATSSHSSSTAFYFGIALFICEQVIFAIGLIVQKHLLNFYPSWYITKWSLVVGAVSCMLIAIGTGNITGLDAITTLTLPDVIGLFYSALLISFLCQTLSSHTSHYLDPTTISFYSVFQPLFTWLILFANHEESLTLGHMVGGIGISVGLYVFAKE